MAKPIFFVATLSEADAVFERARSIAADSGDVFKLDRDKFYIAFDGISVELAEKLGIRSEPFLGSGVVMPVQGYSGRAPTSLWEWLRLKGE